MKLSILIPIFNERIVLETSIRQVLQAPLPEEMERELIMVDDCSTDGSWSIMQALAASHPEIRIYQHEVNQGKGAAIRT
ncbi:MAG: glycosyltransferase, partial [Bryobacterales bacterium]|nr:glycosyltransferase [Bryobacterales bacterium]